MNEPELESLDPDQRRAREAVAGLPDPPADPDFRAALRISFATGAIAAAAEPEADRTVIHRRRWTSARIARWGAVPVAFAALLLMVSVLNRGPSWSLTGTSGLGVAVVDGHPVPINHVEELSTLIRPGSRLSVPAGCDLEIVSGGHLLIEVTGGTEMTVPGRPARWYGRALTAGVERGEIRILTGPGFHGGRLAIATPEARVEVTGSTLAVICEPAGTCVCVLEGHVRMGTHQGPMATIEDGRRRFIFGDGRAEVDEMRESEKVELAAMRERRAAVLEGR